MALKIFTGKEGANEIRIQTDAISYDDYIDDLADALYDAVGFIGASGVGFNQVLRAAMPIAFKLSGYKSDTVIEKRLLSCGDISPDGATIVGSSDGEHFTDLSGAQSK